MFTVGLVGIIAVATDAEHEVTAAAIAFSALAFGFFYVLIPGGPHFGMVTANLLAIYFCLFEFFRHANFAAAPPPYVLVGLGLPVVGFLIGCLVRRQTITELIDERRYREIALLPRLSRWFVAAMTVGAASFALPQLSLSTTELGLILLGLQALVTLLVVASLHDVVLVMVDIATVFELVARRLDRLLMPILAVLTFYALLVIVFACLYRVADMTTLVPQFIVNGEPRRIQFVEALYFSAVTVARSATAISCLIPCWYARCRGPRSCAAS